MSDAVSDSDGPATRIGRKPVEIPREPKPLIDLRHVENDADADIARRLFRDYQAGLGVDLCFQGFEAELASLPSPYVPPRGALLLAEVDGRTAGCVAVRGLKSGQTGATTDCEMKRLYVHPSTRGLGVGRILAEAVIDTARTLGYRRMVLDTLGRLDAALALYRDLGFVEIPEYYHNPVEDVIFLAKTL